MMKRNIAICTVFYLLVFQTLSLAGVAFNDGQYHQIDYIIDDYVEIDKFLPGVGTHLEITATGGIAPRQPYGYIACYGNSKLTLSGGQVGWTIYCLDNSIVTVNSGLIGRSLSVDNNGSMTLNGGSCKTMVIKGYSTANINGGGVMYGVELRDNSTAVISGGQIRSKIMCGGAYSDSDECLIELKGNSFSVNGNSLAAGQSVLDYAFPGSFSGFPCLWGTITGQFANDDMIDVPFYVYGNSDIVYVPEPIMINLDIKPGSCPNPFNVKSKGVLPVAILGTEEFDVSTIVSTSVRLAGVEPIRDSLEDVAAPLVDPNECECSTNGPDGFTDLTLKFKTQAVLEALGEVNTGDILTLQLTGVLNDETSIEGADCVVIVGRFKPFNKADINKDGLVNAVDIAIVAENWLNSSIVDD